MTNSNIRFRTIKALSSTLLLLSVLSSSLATAAPNSRSPMGINTNEIMDTTASIPFADVFKTSLPFEEGRPWITKGKVTYDKHGWPKNLNGGQAGTRFLHTIPAKAAPNGNYTVLYDGEGVLTYSDDAKLVFREKGRDVISIMANRSGKKDEFRVKLIIKHSNPSDHLRNIRVMMPGGVCANNPFRRVNKNQCGGSRFMSFEEHHASLIFNPAYLDYMKDFKVIRFMNMSGITRNPLSHWDKRPKVTDPTWGGKEGMRGAPIEIMVALANKLSADPWFSIPHKANNNFVRQQARYVKNNLKPGLKAYVEYTNEAWNSIFTQAHYVKDMGERMQLDIDRDKGGYKYFSMRSVQIFDMWESEFGGTQRIVRVMGSWVGWTRLTEMLLSYRNAYKKTDAVAIAPYFEPKLKNSKKARSVSQIFKMIYDPKERRSIPEVLKQIKKNAVLAAKFGVELIAYEGGQHLVDWKSRSVNSHPTKLFIAANRDWRMAKAYSDFLRGWKKNGGKLFVNFSAPRTYQWYGAWGTKEHIEQPTSKAPKHKAIVQFARSNPCWWKSCTGAQFARLNKPAHNPVGDVFALVPTKTLNKIPPKKPTAIVAKPATKTPAVAAVAKTIAKIVTPTMIPPTVTVASKNRDLPIWAMKKDDSDSKSKETLVPKSTVTKSKATNKPKVAKAPIKHDAVVHRVKGKGRIWKNKDAMRLANIVDGKINGGKDLSAVWQTHWDNKYLYVRVDAVDDKFVRDSKNPWGDDSIEIYIDADGSRGSKFDGKNDFHLIYRWKDKSVNLSKNSPRKRNMGIQQTMTRTNGGYSLETAIPWTTLGVKPVAGKSIGIDVQVNDDDSGRDRDGKLAWHAKSNNSWTNPKTFGRLILGI
ncbi:MAG: CBM9 family sugar-binding protein [Cocleimonas sp.]|nr:CBM9 family sugar-binding protein [Cocleimonas sp.]